MAQLARALPSSLSHSERPQSKPRSNHQLFRNISPHTVLYHSLQSPLAHADIYHKLKKGEKIRWSSSLIVKNRNI